MIVFDAEFCEYSKTTRREVEKCPSDEISWKEAASKKNCSRYAKNCDGKIAYHCLINPWQNLTVEVCAPETLIRAGNRLIFKGIVSKLTVKFWMCQKYGKMKDYNKKMTTSVVE
jgi:hypothetical protein